jgi:hypothetical protein
VHYFIGAFAGSEEPGEVVQVWKAEVHWFEEGSFYYGLEGFDADMAGWLAEALYRA